MPTSRFVAATVFAFVLQAQGAVAQMAMPSEFPPASYASNQFIDSQGCVFVRASIGGVQSWVPRLTRDRQQLCGFQPTQVAGTTAAPPPVPLAANVPVITIPSAAAPTVTAAATLPEPAPTPRTNVAPIATVASTTTPPRIRATQTQLAAPAPVIAAAPAVTPRIIVEPAAPRRTMTRAQACDGKFGIQPNLVSSRTGQPIDCGPAAAPVAVAAPVVIAAAPQAAQTLNLDAICADISTTGRRYVNARTGLDVRCGPQTQVVSAPVALAAPSLAPQAPSGPSGPPVILSPTVTPAAQRVAPVQVTVAAPAPSCAGFDPIAARLLAGTAQAVRCGPQAQSPSSQAGANRATGTGSNKSRNPFVAEVPASNPPAGTPAPTRPSRGYRSVWDDGRINPNRGLPRVQAAQPQVQVAPAAKVEAPVQATADRYVQVGTFGDQANAQAAVARLQALGLPVGIGSVTRGGQVLQVVAAGPFGSAQALQAGLSQARGAGFGDAFTRR